MYIRQMKYVKDTIQNNTIQELSVSEQFVNNDDAYTQSYNLHIWKKKSLKLIYSKGLLEITKDKTTK